MQGRTSNSGWSLLFILSLLSVFSVLDRQVLTLMVAPIKHDLHLSDFEIGLLQGTVFSFLYGVASLPIGWLVDRFPRRPIIWLGVTLWGLADAACGFARNISQLFLARTAVGIGEASLSPAAYSMLADMFPASRLALAMSIYLMGGTLGNGLAVGLGGMVVALAESGHTFQIPGVGELSSWRYVFLLTGLPGVALGLLVFLVREPPRRRNLDHGRLPLSETFRFIGSHRQFFISHFIGFGAYATMGWAFTSWLPVYMSRSFGWSIERLTMPIALIYGLGGTVGVLLTGSLADRLFRSGRRDAHLRLYVIAAVLTTVAGVASFLVRDPLTFLLLSVPIAVTQPISATGTAALQIVSPNQMRGQLTAIFLLVINGLALGIGPPVVGALTDFVFHDERRVGTSIALMFLVLGPTAALLLSRGLGPMRDAVADAEALRSADAVAQAEAEALRSAGRLEQRWLAKDVEEPFGAEL